MTRRFDSFVCVEGRVLPVDTLPQIKTAEAALLAAGIASARIWVGLPPEAKLTPMRVYAHNAMGVERRAA